MKNTLIADYSFKLENYKFTSSRQERIAAKLFKELPQAKSIIELQNLLSDYLKLSKSDSRSFLTDLIPVSLFSFFTNSGEYTLPLNKRRGQPRDLFQLINSWLCGLELQVTAKTFARETLENFHTSKQVERLINLLRELLNDPKAEMHLHMSNLVKRLNSDDLEKALEQLSNLPPALKAKTQRPGDFFAQAALNKNHATCIALLANNAAAHKDGDRLLALTNSLLQDALIIYKDLHSSEIKEMPVEVIEEQPQSHRQQSYQ
jgi:hypothetical protein